MAPGINLKDTLKQRTLKKLEKFSERMPDLVGVEVAFKRTADLEAPKCVEVRLRISGNDLFASKKSERFETALDTCMDALRKQWEKQKSR